MPCRVSYLDGEIMFPYCVILNAVKDLVPYSSGLHHGELETRSSYKKTGGYKVRRVSFRMEKSVG